MSDASVYLGNMLLNWLKGTAFVILAFATGEWRWLGAAALTALALWVSLRA